MIRLIGNLVFLPLIFVLLSLLCLLNRKTCMASDDDSFSGAICDHLFEGFNDHGA